MEHNPDEMLRRGDIQPTLDARVKWQERALKAEAQLEALQLVASYAQDVLNFWPLMTMRTIRVMIPKMASLKEALELLRGQDRSQS